jgi:hypothetical protein
LLTPFSEAKNGYAMTEDKVVDLKIPRALQDDPLTAVLRSGARRLLAQAIEAEVSALPSTPAC